MKRSKLREIIREEANSLIKEAKDTRELSNAKQNLRNWLDLLVVGQEMKDLEIIKRAKEGIKAAEREMDFRRYGRTDVS